MPSEYEIIGTTAAAYTGEVRECPRCEGAGDLCRCCSGLLLDFPELFGGAEIIPCPACEGSGEVPPGAVVLSIETRKLVVA